MKKIKMEFLYSEFLIYKIVNQGIGDRQVESYKGTFKKLNEDWTFEYLEDMTPEKIERFFWKKLMDEKRKSNTYNHQIKNIKALFNFLVKKEYLKENKINNICKRKAEKRLPKALSKENIKELLKSLNKIFDNWSFTDYRNKILVKTYLYTGARLTEVLNLNLRDISLQDNYIRIIKWKWDKERVIPLHKELKKDLKEYIKERNQYYWTDGILFCSKYKNTLQKRDMRNIINRIRKGVTFYFTWHQLRHTFATELMGE